MHSFESKKKYILLDNLFDLFMDMKFDEDDEKLLVEESIDVNNIVQKNLLLFRQLKTQSKADLYQAKHNRVLAFLIKLREDVESNIDGFNRIAEDIFSKERFAELQPMFRNLTKVSEEDKKSILMDSKLLDLLNDIEEEYNKESHNE